MQPSNYRIPGRLKTIEGDVSNPAAGGHKMIVNLCSINGKWTEDNESVSKRWDKARLEYIKWYNSQYNFKLGEIQEVNVQSDTCIINALVYGSKDPDKLLDVALERCADRIGELAEDYSSNVHLKAVNDENLQQQFIEKVIKRGINVTFYKSNK